VTFQTTVGTANSLLNTVFMNFENSGVSKIRTTQYSIPEELVDYIDLIDPTIFLGKATAAVPISTRKAKASAPPKRSVDASCSTSITPACLKELYNTVGYTPDPQSGSTIGYGSFLNQSSIYSDLLLFEQTFDIPHQNFTTILIAGATNDQNTVTTQFGEADLDVS
jgi:tripeptidyl-peptidase-1